MSTRGAIGFRINHKDKVTYNHSKSYPSWLGVRIMTFVHDTPDIELKEIANRIELVSEDSQPTPEQIKKLLRFADASVGTQTVRDWYCLLRDTQGDLSHYRRGLIYMIDYHEFLADSLFCEWAYIINIDTEELEVYRGLNKRKHVKNGGRYANYGVDDTRRKYYGVVLISTLKFSQIKKMTEEEIKLFCTALDESVRQVKD
jgi:hypothetical protein